jgi:hypothetical protein
VWALGLILLLGWNELTAVLWNPLYWLLAPALFLLGWQLYSELDVDAELERGVVAGGVALWGKAGGALRRVRRWEGAGWPRGRAGGAKMEGRGHCISAGGGPASQGCTLKEAGRHTAACVCVCVC